MSKRLALGCCALGLALLAGCTLYVGDPDPPPPADPPPPPPDDQPPPQDLPLPLPADPPPPPPTSLGDNVPADEYDATNHRLLVSDCVNNALVAVNLLTGERSVLIDTWPWTEPENEPCVGRIAVHRDGRRAFAAMWRTYLRQNGEPGEQCISYDLVSLDLETREVTPLQNIDVQCCDDFCGGYSYYSLQFDDHRQRLLNVVADSVADYSTHFLSSTPYGTAQETRLGQLYASDCYPDDDLCAGQPWFEVEGLSFDPASPDQRLLVLSRRYPIGEFGAGQYVLDRMDVATGAITESRPLALIDGDLSAGVMIDLSVDIEKQRVLFTWGSSSSQKWLVFALDLATGEEALLYDGSPTAGGARLECRPNPAFDSRTRRLLLSEQIDGANGCTNGVFAVDADTGAFTQILRRL